MWWIWLLIAVALLIGELLTEGFFLFWFAIGAAVACLASLLVPSLPIQLAVFIGISAVLLFCSKRLWEKVDKSQPSTNVDALLGREGIITGLVKPHSRGMVKIGGEEWSCIASGNILLPEGTVVRIESVSGVTLTVIPILEEKEA